MLRQLWDDNWNFCLQEGFTSFIADWRDMSKAKKVHLPHDFQMELGRSPESLAGSWGAFYKGGIGTYQKSLFAPTEWDGKRILLDIEGAYMNAEVSVNRELVAIHHYGYTSFLCDIAPYLKLDAPNTITIVVNGDHLPNTRWYSGAGLYRHVYLCVMEKTHIAPWGTFVSTTQADEYEATLRVQYVINHEDENIVDGRLITQVIDSMGITVAQVQQNIAIAANVKEYCTPDLNIIVPNPKLWDCTTPHLYTLISTLRTADTQDVQRTTFGIRTLKIDVDQGLLLNGERVILRGACAHHDNGVLGAASFDDAEYRKVHLLKQSGFNAIRCAHNPPAPSFLDACDALGMLVIDEAFDAWCEGKVANDYHLYFKGHWEQDMRSMVLRDRNHPSIFIWSTGNEIFERDGRNNGYEWAQKLAQCVRACDDTRPVTHAICDIWYPNEDAKEHFFITMEPFVQMLDAVGYNYQLARYEADHEAFPHRVFIGTETFANEAWENYAAAQEHPYVLGDFVWTGMDYLGESGIGMVRHDGIQPNLGEYPWHQAWCGDIDVCGNKRSQSYYRDAVYQRDTCPYIAVHKPENYQKPTKLMSWAWPDVVSSWTFPNHQDKPTQVDVYSSCEEIELIQDGISLGRKSTYRCQCSFTVTYRDGELCAVGYKQNIAICKSTLATASEPVSLFLAPESNTLKPQYGSLCYVDITFRDEHGQLAQQCEAPVHIHVQGGAKLIALGTANPSSPEEFTAHERHAHAGRLLAVVCATGEEGDAIITATTPNLPAATLRIPVVATNA